MRHLGTLLTTVGCLLAAPAAVLAQASITGTVKDASEAVLPGVTVEASSPALIEKVRSVATDGTGQYRIELLPPGIYAVTFSLPGFSLEPRRALTVPLRRGRVPLAQGGCLTLCHQRARPE